MYGAILGDIVGSPYEFDCNNYKAKDFPLFSRRSDFTDDTVMTLAVAKALRSSRGQDDAAIKAALVHEMQRLGRVTALLCGESPLEGSIPFDVGRYREQLGEIDE